MAFVFGPTDVKLDAATAPATPPPPTRTSFGADGEAAKANALKSPTKLGEGVEGTVSFKSRGFVSYRYQITTKNDKLRIWLEDTKSKKQWETEMLALEDFVREDTVIPMATFNDYAVCFANCLQNTTSSDFACDLAPAPENSDAWVLSLTLKLRVFVTEWTPTYTMRLKPIALEPTDMLAAKIRDQEDQVQRLENQVKLLMAKAETPVMTTPVFATGRSRESVAIPDVMTGRSRHNVTGGVSGQNATSNQPIVWLQDSLFGNIAIVFKPRGGIVFAVAATFVINLMIPNTNSSNNTPTIELLLNGKTEVSIRDSNANAHVQSTAMCHILRTKSGDELQVLYKGSNQVLQDGRIVIFQLR